MKANSQAKRTFKCVSVLMPFAILMKGLRPRLSRAQRKERYHEIQSRYPPKADRS